MTEEVFRYVITAGVAIACISFLVQTALVFGLYKAAKTLQTKVTGLTDRAQPIIDTTRHIIDENRPKISEIGTRAVEIANVAKEQSVHIGQLIGEVSARTKKQVERIDGAIDDTVGRVQNTTTAVQSTIMKPVREVNGLVSGVRAALANYTRGNRASVDHATQDEEMFI